MLIEDKLNVKNAAICLQTISDFTLCKRIFIQKKMKQSHNTVEQRKPLKTLNHYSFIEFMYQRKEYVTLSENKETD